MNALFDENAGKLQILIVEPSDETLLVLKDYLKGPYEIHVVGNCKRAVAAAGSRPFDLIIMDMQAPVIDRLTAARLIREAEQRDGRDPVPLLALTPTGCIDDDQMSLAAGCSASVAKPFSQQELLHNIAKYVRTSIGDKASSSLSISIPPGLEAAAKRYMSSRKKELSSLFQLATEGHFDQVRVLAHNIKGTGTSYGFPPLTQLGRVIEVSAKAHNGVELSQQLLALAAYVDEADKCMQTFT